MKITSIYTKSPNQVLKRNFQYRFWAFCVFVLGICLTSFAKNANDVGPENSFLLVHNYQDDWQVFDEKYKAYIPYLKNRHQNYHSFSLFFNLEDSKGYHLLYFSPNENYLFINASLQKKLPANQWVTLNSDSLSAIYHQSEIFLTFYSNTPGLSDKTVLVGNRKKNGQASSTALLPDNEDQQQTTQLRNLTPFNDFFVLIGLFLFTGYAFLIRFHSRAYEKYFNLRDLITLSKRSDSYTDRPFDISNVLVLVHLCMVLAYILLLVASTSTALGFVSKQTLFDFSGGFISIAWAYSKLSIFIFILFLAKYLGLLLLGQLYKLDKIINVHYFKIIQASSLFFGLMLVIVVFCFFSYHYLSPSIFKGLVFVAIAFFLARLVLLFFVINKLSLLKNLYLFSYLCIIEFFPIIIGVRFAI